MLALCDNKEKILKELPFSTKAQENYFTLDINLIVNGGLFNIFYIPHDSI